MTLILEPAPAVKVMSVEKQNVINVKQVTKNGRFLMMMKNVSRFFYFCEAEDTDFDYILSEVTDFCYCSSCALIFGEIIFFLIL